uniref:Plasmodium vivax Vir protein n=1 Tax=Parastrongyloides trichosuri TaxID=131310 RepID=A0A0N4Z2P8_PARTI
MCFEQNGDKFVTAKNYYNEIFSKKFITQENKDTMIFYLSGIIKFINFSPKDYFEEYKRNITDNNNTIRNEEEKIRNDFKRTTVIILVNIGIIMLAAIAFLYCICIVCCFYICVKKECLRENEEIIEEGINNNRLLIVNDTFSNLDTTQSNKSLLSEDGRLYGKDDTPKKQDTSTYV